MCATPKLVLKQQWPLIRKWVIGIGTKGAPRVPTAFAALDTPDITDPLGAMAKPDRIRVADGVVDRLIQSVGSESAGTCRDEFDRLSKNAQGAMEPNADPLVGCWAPL